MTRSTRSTGESTTASGRNWGRARRGPLEFIRVVAPLAILVAGLAAFMALRSLKATPTAKPRPPAKPLVETVTVAPHEGGMTFQVDGLVVPFREINLSAEVAGRIARKHEACRPGTFVTKGTPLIEIDGRDYELEVRRLERELAQADVTLKELDVEVENTKSLVELAREQLALQRKELERIQSLRGNRVVTDSEADRTKRDELAAMNSVMTLDNQLSLLGTRRSRLESARDLWQTQLDRARLDLSRTQIAAPIDGVIVEEMVEEDSFVQKGDSLARLEDTSAVEVRCNLRMDQLFWLWSQESGRTPEVEAVEFNERRKRDYQIPHAPVTVTYDLAGKRFVWDGVLSRFDGIGVDERTRTVPCRALVANPREVRLELVDGQPGDAAVGPPALVRGMYVTVRVQANPQTPLFEIPDTAVRPGNKVWEVVDGKLAIRKVRVAHTGPDVVLVHSEGSDLQPGAKLVSSPLAMAEDGMAVEERTAE